MAPLSLTPRFSGVIVRCRCGLNRFSGFPSSRRRRTRHANPSTIAATATAEARSACVSRAVFGVPPNTSSRGSAVEDSPHQKGHEAHKATPGRVRLPWRAIAAAATAGVDLSSVALAKVEPHLDLTSRQKISAWKRGSNRAAVRISAQTMGDPFSFFADVAFAGPEHFT